MLITSSRMLRRTFCLAVPFGLSAQTDTGEGPRQLIERAVADGFIPGAVSLIERDGITEAKVAAGWQDIEARLPMAESTIFDVRSLTKPVTAIAALTLVEEGKLDLDASVKEQLPEISAFGAKTPITLRQLLTHTAGLRQERPVQLHELTEKRDRTLSEVVSILTREQLIAEPGERWGYSSQGFAIVGRLVEVVAGRPFHRYVEERVLQPLGMRDSFFHPDGRPQKRLAALYSWNRDQDRLEPWPRTLPVTQWTYDAPDFGLYSTASDLTLLLKSMWPTANGVLSESTRAQMLAPQVETDLPGLLQGLGWFVTRGQGVCSELGVGGGCFGANGSGGSMAWADPTTRQTAVYLQQVFFGSDETGGKVTGTAFC